MVRKRTAHNVLNWMRKEKTKRQKELKMSSMNRFPGWLLGLKAGRSEQPGMTWRPDSRKKPSGLGNGRPRSVSLPDGGGPSPSAHSGLSGGHPMACNQPAQEKDNRNPWRKCPPDFALPTGVPETGLFPGKWFPNLEKGRNRGNGSSFSKPDQNQVGIVTKVTVPEETVG